MSNSLVLWILFAANFVSIVLCENCQIVGTEACENEMSQDKINWPSQCEPSDKLIVSYQHRCLDSHKHYVTRTCSQIGLERVWVPELSEIHCSYWIDEYTIRTPCPPDYMTLPGVLDDIKICVRILPPQRWDNICLSSGSSLTIDKLDKDTIDKLYQERYAIHLTSSFWMPAGKIWQNKLTEFDVTEEMDLNFQWTLAGKLGKSVELTVPIQPSDNDCMGYYFEAPVLKTDNHYLNRHKCDGSQWLTLLCLYDQQQPTMLQLSCPDGYKTTRYAHYQNKCIKIHKFDAISRDEFSDDFVKEHICENIFYVDSGFALYIFQQMSLGEQLTESDRCLFGIIPGKVIITEEEWTKLDMSKVEFINWSFDVSMSPTNSDGFLRNILVTKGNGEWIWGDNLVTCAICFEPNVVQKPNFKLSKDTEASLVLVVQNEKFLWKDDDIPNGISCFSYTFKSKNIVNVEITPMKWNVTHKNYKLSTNGTGKYWCVGLQMELFEMIEAEFTWHSPMKFAFIARNFTKSQNQGRPLEELLHEYLKDSLDEERFHIIETSLQSSLTSSRHLFHVVIIPITDDFLKFEENLIKLNERMLVAYYIQHSLNEICWSLPDVQIESLNSTEFCLPKTISQSENFFWSGARIGRYVTSNELCLLKRSGLPATKRCVGDGLYGGIWHMESSEKVECNNDVQSPSTGKLHKLLNLQMSSEDIRNNVYQLNGIIFQSNHYSLTAADIFYISQIMDGIQHSVAIFPLHYDDVRKILQIYNRLLKINGTVMHTASSLNATNVLLDAVDVIVGDFATNTKHYDNTNTSSNGILSFEFEEPMLSTFIFNPELNNVTGIFATQRSSSELTVEFLNKNERIEDIMRIADLKVASYVPVKLLQHLNNPLIIVSLFINDVLFQSYNTSSSNNSIQLTNSSGSIISIVLPGTSGTNSLPEKLPIFIKPDQRNDNDNDFNVCGFWSFSPNDNGWASSACQLNGKSFNFNIVLCECLHLTHFAYLFYGNTPIDMKHFDKLQLITTIACSISLIGLVGIYVSAIFFQSWRLKSSTKFLLQISFALTMELIIIIFVNTESNSRIWMASGKSAECIALGALLHYTMLVTFLWMLIIGYMQYMRYVVVFHALDSKRFLLMSSLTGWGLPLIPVVTVLLVDGQSYIPTTGNYSICYPSGYSLYCAVMAPIAIITTVNFTIFGLIIKSLTNNLAKRNESRANILSKIRLWIFLFFLLGLTWIFAFLSATNAGFVFTYLFCATATLQGFILFIYFVILDPYLRGLWISLCCKKCK